MAEAELGEIMGARVPKNFAYIRVNRPLIVDLMTFDTFFNVTTTKVPFFRKI